MWVRKILNDHLPPKHQKHKKLQGLAVGVFKQSRFKKMNVAYPKEKSNIPADQKYLSRKISLGVSGNKVFEMQPGLNSSTVGPFPPQCTFFMAKRPKSCRSFTQPQAFLASGSLCPQGPTSGRTLNCFPLRQQEPKKKKKKNSLQ